MKWSTTYGNVKSYIGNKNNFHSCCKAQKFLSLYKIRQRFDFLIISEDKETFTIEFGNDVDFEQYIIEKTKHLLYCIHQKNFKIEPVVYML